MRCKNPGSPAYLLARNVSCYNFTCFILENNLERLFNNKSGVMQMWVMTPSANVDTDAGFPALKSDTFNVPVVSPVSLYISKPEPELSTAHIFSVCFKNR